MCQSSHYPSTLVWTVSNSGEATNVRPARCSVLSNSVLRTVVQRAIYGRSYISAAAQRQRFALHQSNSRAVGRAKKRTLAAAKYASGLPRANRATAVPKRLRLHLAAALTCHNSGCFPVWCW